jgi:biotin transport system substrate-specific component
VNDVNPFASTPLDISSPPETTLTRALGVVLFAALTAVGATLAFPLPFTPVPVTLQTLAVILAGAMLGPVWGPASQLLYLGAGICGLPVFAGGIGGPAVLLGPTGGYLIGFVVGAWIAGLLLRPGSGWVRLGAGLLASHAAIFVCGLSRLLAFTGMSVPAALELGFFPFLPGLAVKTVAAAVLLQPQRVLGWFRA